jgi:hypothetical protein
MFLGREQIKQNIMLGTDSQKGSHLIHIVEQVVAKHFGCAGRRLDQSSQHRDGCGFASAIVP